MRPFFFYFPLLAIPAFLYNIIAVTAGGANSPQDILPIINRLDAVILKIPMLSSGQWNIELGEILLFISLIMLFIETLKSSSTKTNALINHSFSMLLLLVCFMEFLLLENFATSVFFLMTVMTLLDVLAGFIIGVITARRDFGIGYGLGGG